MQFRSLGPTDLKVSNLCLGTMQLESYLSEKESFAVLDAFLDAGGNFIDTADMYASWVPGCHGGEAESSIGKWHKRKKNRSKLVIATKVRAKMWDGPDGEGLSEKHIIRACEESLKRLQTDRIDLYQAHWPDPKTPIAETMKAFKKLQEQGKVRNIGVSNFSGSTLSEAILAIEECGGQIVTNQPHYNLVKRKDFEEKALPEILSKKIGVIPYSPLAEGFLTGKYRKGKSIPKSVRAQKIKDQKMTEENFAVVDTLDRIAKEKGKTVLQIALAWHLNHDWITAPIIGANSVEQLKESLGASSLKLTSDEKRELDNISQNL